MDNLTGISLRQLRCFVVTCESRSVAQAARTLGITQSVASRHISELDVRIGATLFDRVGRRMEPTVAIGALPSVSGTLVPEALLSLQSVWPRLQMRVETGTGDHLLQQLRIGQLDVVAGRMGSPKALANLTFEPLYRDRLGAFVRRRHPLTAGVPKPSALSDYPMILPPAAAVVRATVDAFLLARGSA